MGRTLAPVADPSRLYFKQLLAGMDLAEGDRVAEQMVNFVYLIGDRETGEAVVVDPAYDQQGILDALEADGMRLTGALATHYHADHVGGSLGGMAQITGIAELLELVDVPIHVQADEAEWIGKTTPVSAATLTQHQSGDTVMVGEIPITLIHTPGHTPGSQCFLVDGQKLVSGDTLFLDGCGRTDLPGSNPEEQERITSQWEEHQIPIELQTLYSPYRELSRPILRYVDELDDQHGDDFVTVVVPEFARDHWWQQVLHNQSALVLRNRLRSRPNTVVTSVPFHVDDDRDDVVTGTGADDPARL